MGLGGAGGGATISVPRTGAGTAVGRDLSAYRMHPVTIARPAVLAAR
jgi:hypothetical protein